jgi:hypothetical protein
LNATGKKVGVKIQTRLLDSANKEVAKSEATTSIDANGNIDITQNIEIKNTKALVNRNSKPLSRRSFSN